ncbi:hypothetical protein [Sphingobium chlorophenolicum]|uniref:hypothetical protein n=1 Tax=Sphingobium chlorophenolicum TaxID=46429 RepID=UPI001BDD7CF4|nr:hypothetical protein [Sphingobium chlorophenolicum]
MTDQGISSDLMRKDRHKISLFSRPARKSMTILHSPQVNVVSSAPLPWQDRRMFDRNSLHRRR